MSFCFLLILGLGSVIGLGFGFRLGIGLGFRIGNLKIFDSWRWWHSGHPRPLDACLTLEDEEEDEAISAAIAQYKGSC